MGEPVERKYLGNLDRGNRGPGKGEILNEPGGGKCFGIQLATSSLAIHGGALIFLATFVLRIAHKYSPLKLV